jgi:hypothetical protein
MTTEMTNPRTPWTLHLDRDGTEDFLIVCDAEGHNLARSEFFWQPEDENDAVPTPLAAMWLMFKSPKLLDALKALAEHAGHDCPAQARSCFLIEALEQATAVIADATSRPPYISRHGRGVS